MKLLRLHLLALFAASIAQASAESPARPAAPNVLFILTEDQGAHLSFLGTPGLATPNLDSIARSSVCFRQAFVAYPVCSASKASIYTGLHSHTNGLLNNTLNYHKPADKLSETERAASIYVRNRIRAEIPTLVERFHEAGYYQGVTHKLHVAPNEKFPYDEFSPKKDYDFVRGFIQRAAAVGKPWHLFFNVENSHRPYPNSDKERIRVRPSQVHLPAYLPDTPIVRQDWAEYLAAIEEADAIVGDALRALRDSGEAERTIIVFLGDHGPTFPHGKMTLYDLGLRTPLCIRVPGVTTPRVSDALVSTVDLAPTLLDLIGLAPLPASHGVSLKSLLQDRQREPAREFVFAEISHISGRAQPAMQERTVYDGRWKLIYREHTTPPWRIVQEDARQWKTWGNRSYAEIVRQQKQFPEAFRVLREFDPQTFDGTVPRLELYDLKTDPHEMINLVRDPAAATHRDRLYVALRDWTKLTQDSNTNMADTPAVDSP